jgi:electron transfer flavoprotein alpha subunit
VKRIRFTVAAWDATTAQQLLSIVPPDQPVELVLLGVDASQIPPSVRLLPVDRIVAVSGARPGDQPAVVGTALARILDAASVVVLDSTQDSRDLAGWMCATLDLPLVWAIDAIRLTDRDGIEADRIVLGGSHRLVHFVGHDRTVVVMARPTRESSRHQHRASPAEVVIHDVPAPRSRLRLGGARRERVVEAPLAAARTVIGIGRGVGGADRVPLFRELAERVGGALGASRVAVDSGWVPFSHQVGQTGTAVAPDLYIAFGISGAIQHLAGMRGSKQIVAVNTDKNAPLCHLADLVIEADANEVAAGLLERLDAHAKLR